jgi:sugar phosphate permease
MKEPPRGQADLVQGVHPAKVNWRTYLIFLRTPSYVLCTMGMTAMTFAMGGIAFWMAYYLKGKPGAPPAVTTIFGAITVAAGLSATLLGGWVGDKLRARIPGSYFLVSGLGMLAGFPFLLLAVTSSFPMIWVWLFITCFCLFFNTGPTNTILANVTHPAIRSAGFALAILVTHGFGDVISPVVIGIISDRYNMTTGFIVVSVMFLAAGVLWLAGMKFLQRDTALAPQQDLN